MPAHGRPGGVQPPQPPHGSSGQHGSGQRGSEQRSRGRGKFWVGFVVGFLLLTLASCSGAALMLGFGRLSLADLRGDANAWTPPTLIATPEGSLVAQGNEAAQAGSGRFTVGRRVRNITASRVNVRATPGHLGKPEGDIVAQLAPGEQVEILGESAAANNLVWHKVLVQGIEGWVAESTASGVQILGE